MENLHIVLILIVLAIVGYLLYVNFVQNQQEKRDNKPTGKAPLMNMPPPPSISEQLVAEEVVDIYADSIEDVMTYYEDPEIEFGISKEEFDALVQKEIEKREYKVKKIERTKYMNEDKARKINDITRNQLETLTLNQMKKRTNVVDEFYDKRSYDDFRDYKKTYGNRHQISMLEGQELSRPYADTIQF